MGAQREPGCEYQVPQRSVGGKEGRVALEKEGYYELIERVKERQSEE